MSYADVVSDVLVALQYLATPGLESWASWTFGSLALSLVTQATVAFVFQPGRGRWREAGLALVGVKPIVETWRVLTGAPKPKGHKFPHEGLLALSLIHI